VCTGHVPSVCSVGSSRFWFLRENGGMESACIGVVVIFFLSA
jgi:hypothetical protein